MLILEKKSFPNFSRKSSDHSRTRAAAPREDDGAEKPVFYCELLSDRDTRMRRRTRNSDRIDTTLKLRVSFVGLTNGCFCDCEAAAA